MTVQEAAWSTRPLQGQFLADGSIESPHQALSPPRPPSHTTPWCADVSSSTTFHLYLMPFQWLLHCRHRWPSQCWKFQVSRPALRIAWFPLTSQHSGHHNRSPVRSPPLSVWRRAGSMCSSWWCIHPETLQCPECFGAASLCQRRYQPWLLVGVDFVQSSAGFFHPKRCQGHPLCRTNHLDSLWHNLWVPIQFQQRELDFWLQDGRLWQLQRIHLALSLLTAKVEHQQSFGPAWSVEVQPGQMAHRHPH